MTQTELLKAALKERGVTQRAVAERLGTTEQALSKTLSRPTLTTTKLAAILDAVNALAPYHQPLTAEDLHPLPDTLVINGVNVYQKRREMKDLIKIGETTLYFATDDKGRAWPVADDSISDLIMPSDALKLVGTDDYCEIEVFVRRKS